MPVKSFLKSGLLILLSSILFSLSHPSFLFEKGLSFFSWIYFIPLFFVLKSSSNKVSFIYGFLFGFLSNCLLCSWLFIYSLPSMIAVALVYGIFWALLFFILLQIQKKGPPLYWLIDSFLLLGFEWFRSRGSFGFSYGVPGYTQWNNAVLLQSASIFGVWGLTFLIYCVNTFIPFVLDNKKRIRQLPILLFFFVFIVGGGNLYSKKLHKSVYTTLPVVLIQNNASPWKSGIEEYKKEVASLVELTEQALTQHPDTRIVVWSETAVVVDILYHYKNRSDYERSELVKNLLEYMDSKQCTFIIGNNRSILERGEVYHFNSTLCFTPGNCLPPKPQIYAKRHLVPLSEYVPASLGFLRFIVSDLDTHEWNRGRDDSAFDVYGIKIVTPICYEDTFDYEVKSLVQKNDADLIVNVTNDSWSSSRACQMQHLSMAVFRSVENHIPTVRSAVSGETCSIAADGSIKEWASPMSPTWIYCQVEIQEKIKTLE